MGTDAKHSSIGPSTCLARTLLATIVLAALAAALLPAAAAASPAPLWTACDSIAPAGQRCDFPRGVATDPENGHVFVADQNNHRVDEISPLGEFIAAWGWDVVESGPGNTGIAFEICVPEEGDVCKAGIEGTGAGQFKLPQGVAVDSVGNVYVADVGNDRVEKFNRKGEFDSMFGRQVNKTKVAEREAQEVAAEPVTVTEEEEDICPFDPGDECGPGIAGTGPGQFHWGGFAGNYIAVGPGDKLYVGDQERIERFDGNGAFQDECSVPGTGNRVQSLAADPTGKLYAVYAFRYDVRKLTYGAGSECEETMAFEIPQPDEFTHPVPTATAVDADGDVYAFSDTAGNGIVS